jgi:glycosyltransferase involved in cell wall biosynthesis
MRAAIVEAGLEGHVTLLGTRDDVPDLLAAADVLGFASRSEGAAGTLLEAMALACPIVSTNLPTLAQTIDTSTALLVPVGEAAPLANALVEALTNREQAHERAARAREVFLQEFSIEISARRMAELYRRVAGRVPRA